MRKIKFILISFEIILGIAFFLFYPKEILASEKVEIYFFWGQGCPHCAQEKPFLEELKQKYPQLEIKEFEVYFNRENQELFQKIAQAYNTQPEGVPMTFIGKDAFIGFAIRNGRGVIFDPKEGKEKDLEELIQKCFQTSCPSPGEILAAGGIDKWKPDKELPKEETKKEISISLFGKEIKISSQSSLFLLGVILGLAEGINPCMLSVLLFLLSYILAIGSKERAIKVGLVYVLSVFVVFSLFLIGLLKIMSLITFISKIKIVIAIFTFIVSLILIKEFFAYGKWISLEIPESTKPWIEKLIKRGTIPSAILLGVLASMVEIPCTVGIPLIYTTILAQKSKIFHIPYIIWFSFFVIFPLLIIISGVAFAFTQVEKIEKWRLNFRKYMRLVAGLILLFLSIALFKGWM
jgi:cytochrome c biogenesis protein CcdA/thiol-disulfide isomerase/thioredoxin